MSDKKVSGHICLSPPRMELGSPKIYLKYYNVQK